MQQKPTLIVLREFAFDSETLLSIRQVWVQELGAVMEREHSPMVPELITFETFSVTRIERQEATPLNLDALITRVEQYLHWLYWTQNPQKI